MRSGTFTLVLAKEDFKFSCGHFTLFDAERAELLHGHNYQVAVELSGPALDDEELLVDFAAVKSKIRAACARLDSHTLVPARSRHLRVVEEGGSVEVAYRDRRYRLPTEDVILLPLANTSIEALARMLWRELASEVEWPAVEAMGVCVAETAGQSCWYRAPVRAD